MGAIRAPGSSECSSPIAWPNSWAATRNRLYPEGRREGRGDRKIGREMREKSGLALAMATFEDIPMVGLRAWR